MDNNNGGAIVSKWLHSGLAMSSWKLALLQSGAAIALANICYIRLGRQHCPRSRHSISISTPVNTGWRQWCMYIHGYHQSRCLFHAGFCMPRLLGINIALSKKHPASIPTIRSTLAVFRGSDKEKPGAVQWIVTVYQKGAATAYSFSLIRQAAIPINCIVKSCQTIWLMRQPKRYQRFKQTLPSL